MMRNFQLTLGLLVVSALAFANTANAGNLTMASSDTTPNAVTVVVGQDGNLSYNNGGGQLVSTFELVSDPAMFDPSGVADGVILPPFDTITETKVFKLTTDGADSVDFGPVVTNTSADDLLAAFTLNGSLLPSGGLDTAAGGGPYLFVVPEPSSIALLGLGVLGLLSVRRKRS